MFNSDISVLHLPYTAQFDYLGSFYGSFLFQIFHRLQIIMDHGNQPGMCN